MSGPRGPDLLLQMVRREAPREAPCEARCEWTNEYNGVGPDLPILGPPYLATVGQHFLETFAGYQAVLNT